MNKESSCDELIRERFPVIQTGYLMPSTPVTDSGTAHGNSLIFLAMAIMCISHLIVDTVAGQLSPLWPDLALHYGLTSTAGSLLVWTLSTSVFQLLFGLLGDARPLRWMIVVGPAIAVVCLSTIGLTHSAWVMQLLLLGAGLGIAAYHPEAAAMSGNIWPGQRSRAMSIFAMGGYAGQAIGPYYSGLVVDRAGLPGLAWGLVWGGAAILCFGLALCRYGWGNLPQPSKNQSLPLQVIFRGKMGLVSLLLAIGALRVVTVAGIPVAMGYVLAERNWLKADVGAVQAAFMAGIGVAGLACAIGTSARWERALLWLPTLVSIPLLGTIPFAVGNVLTGEMFLAGFLLGLSLPVFISTGQRLLPDSPRIASSITMGVSWGIGGGLVSGMIYLCEATQSYHKTYFVFAITALASSLLCAWLPQGDKWKSAEIVGMPEASPAMTKGDVREAAL